MRRFTISQISEVTGLKTRTIQFWTLNGVIECDPETRHGGPGVPRTYSLLEASIAAILAKFSNVSLPVGELLQITEKIRNIWLEPNITSVKELEVAWSNVHHEFEWLFNAGCAFQKVYGINPDKWPLEAFEDRDRMMVDWSRYNNAVKPLLKCAEYFGALWPGEFNVGEMTKWRATGTAGLTIIRAADSEWDVMPFEPNRPENRAWYGFVDDKVDDWRLTFVVNLRAAFKSLQS